MSILWLYRRSILLQSSKELSFIGRFQTSYRMPYNVGIRCLYIWGLQMVTSLFIKYGNSGLRNCSDRKQITFRGRKKLLSFSPFLCTKIHGFPAAAQRPRSRKCDWWNRCLPKSLFAVTRVSSPVSSVGFFPGYFQFFVVYSILFVCKCVGVFSSFLLLIRLFRLYLSTSCHFRFQAEYCCRRKERVESRRALPQFWSLKIIEFYVVQERIKRFLSSKIVKGLVGVVVVIPRPRISKFQCLKIFDPRFWNFQCLFIHGFGDCKTVKCSFWFIALIQLGTVYMS